MKKLDGTTILQDSVYLGAKTEEIKNEPEENETEEEIEELIGIWHNIK